MQSCIFFQRRESCDTVASAPIKDGENAHETIIAECHPLICDKSFQSFYYAYQPSGPSRCYLRNGKEISTLNVPPSTQSNLCRMQPRIPGQCTWKQGMLMLNMQGSEHADLYVDATLKYMSEAASTLAKEGAGLFMHGGNPIYYTMKASPQDVADKVHSILRGNLDDLAGDHIVLKVAKDTNTLQPFMYVHRTPLASNLWQKGSNASSPASSKDPIESIFALSKLSVRPSGGNRGWLSNLASEMRAEQPALDKLYPTSSSSSEDDAQQQGRWSCPLLRYAFWSKVVQDFSPLVPSPIRAARLFGEESGRNMIHGTRSHPTQLFTSLYNRLANVMTSNGFCFCVDPKDCQVLHSDAQNADCSLLETIRSLYDQKPRRIRLLQKNASCTQQLDWPFEEGWMRDGSPNGGINDPAQPCNVLDRLPPFQYRYRPVGEIKPSSDGKTSLDEGGSCHMGRAAGLHPRFSTVTTASACRKIHSNYTHVVARCTNTDGTYEDLEMRKEMSAAPTWMVDAMKTQRRQRCSQCSAPPVWKTEFSNEDLPHGPEVSYGIPFRWSASRLLAADARAAACEGKRHNISVECDSLLRLENWTPEQFMQHYMTGTMPDLFSNSVKAPPSIAEALANASATMTEDDEDHFLWTGGPGWVACTQMNITCHGTMSKREWSNRKTRGASCNRVFAEEVRKGNVNSTAVGLDVCNLNDKTNALCQKLKEAQV